MAHSRPDSPPPASVNPLTELPSSAAIDMASLLHLIYQLQQALTPQRPSESFRIQLGRDLLIAAREQQSAAGERRRRRLTSPWTLLAAGIASAVSVVVGIITYVIWHRTRAATG